MRVEAIHKLCQQKMAVAIRQTHSIAKSAIDESFGTFYGGGSPIRYARTGTLLGSEDVREPIISGNIVYLDAGYDSSKIGYSTGTFSGEEVFEATASGSAGVVGNPSYDDMALQQIIAAAEAAFGAQFG